MRTALRPDPRHLSRAFLLLIAAQAVHSIEEYWFRLYDLLAPARAVSDALGLHRPTGFIIANAALIGFGLWCYLARIRPGRPGARGLAWFWAVLEILNGLAHGALALAAGGYFPGIATAPLLLVAALLLVRALVGRLPAKAGLLALPILVLAATLPASPARADSWVAPQRTTYYSANRGFRLIVTPHIPADRDLRPFVTEPRGPSAPGSAHAVLQRRDGGGRWRLQWQGALRNEVMPVEAMVADSGRYFVTFDDWGGGGSGPNVVVIYDGAGRVIRAFSLPDLVSEDYALALPHSFSSIYWGGGTGFSADGDRLLLAIPPPTKELFQDGGAAVRIEVVLATGRLIPPSGPAWENALAATARIRATQRAWAARRLAFMTDPLLGPADGDRNAWEEYLTEAYYRLYPGPVHPTGWALEWPGAPRYADTRGFVATILRRSRLSPDVAILLGSPDEEDLIRFLAETLGQIPPGPWRGGNFYVAAHDANWPRIAALIAPTGATPVQIDPTEPIPQLPARLRTYIETGASGPLTPAESTQD